MIQFRSWKYVIGGACLVTALCVGLLNVHLIVNYPPELRDIVRWRATAVTFLLAFPICLFFFWQMLQNFRLSQELQRLVDRDRLTDVATRDYFFGQMARAPEAYGVSLMVDIDHFKRVNDRYGHLVGDAAIQAVAGVLRESCREEDIVCRFGGEEFVIFLWDADDVRGQEVAGRILDAVEAADIEVDGRVLSVTVSIGGALKAAADHIDAAIKEADAALYEAKRAGRNRAVLDWVRRAA